MNKLYISLLLIFMPAFIACADRPTTIAKLQENLASAQEIDAFVKNEIIAYKKTHPADRQLKEFIGSALWNQRFLSISDVGKAERALKDAQA